MSRSMSRRRDHLQRPHAIAWLEHPVGLPIDLDEVAFHLALRLGRAQGLVSGQDGSVALRDRDLDPAKLAPDAGYAAGMVTDRKSVVEGKRVERGGCGSDQREDRNR